MTEIRHFCDRCSVRITSDRTLMKVQCGPQRPQRPAVELCSTCLTAFAAWLDDRPADCTAPTPRASKANRTTSHAPVAAN